MKSFPRAFPVFNLRLAEGVRVPALAVTLVLAHGAAPAAERDFVRVRGTEFALGDEPFRFVGVTAAAMHGPERAQAAETMAAAARDGFQVVRVWALGEGERGSETWRRDDFLFRMGPGGWVSRAFEQLDLVIEAAGQADLRLIIVLANSWRDYGGVPQYLRWLGRGNANRYGFEDEFYESERAFAFYEQHVRKVVGRTNARTDVAYREDPTILSWELMNESHVSRRGLDARHRWARRAAALVKSIDSNHLVTIGHAGYRLERERAAWVRDHRAPEIDYCDHHLYLERIGGIRDMQDLYDRIDDRAQLSRFVVKKPLVVGEFGFDNQREQWLGRSRSELHEAFVERALADGASGVLAWIYLPPGIERRRFPIQWGSQRHARLRAALGRVAVRAKQGVPPNRRLGPDVGGAYLFPRHSISGRAGRVASPRSRGKVLEFRIPARDFHRARWEVFGTWAEERPAHAYGAETGHFEYAFAVPRGRPTRVDVSARISSEFPGRLSPPDGTSHVRVSIEGAAVGDWEATPDDGRGRTERLSSTDASVLERLGGGIAHLRLEVADGGEEGTRNGLCVYDPGVTVRVHYGTR